MSDSKPQRCVQQHKSLKMTRNAAKRNKHINEASKQTLANNLLKISCKYMQGMFSDWEIRFNVINIRTYDINLCNLRKYNKTLM